jgi:hypothetical protein
MADLDSYAVRGSKLRPRHREQEVTQVAEGEGQQQEDRS